MARPEKYDSSTLMQCIETYQAKYKNQFTTLSPTKIAKYMTDVLGMPAHYQDLTRKEDIKAYIAEFNKNANDRAKSLVHRHAVDSDMPFFTPLNVMQFLKKNNTQKKLEAALISLDSIREKDHESYTKLVSKLVEVGEKYAILNQEKIILINQLEQLKKDFEEQLKVVKKELIKTKKKSKEHLAKANVYEHFLRKHHFQKIEEMALYLENIIHSGIDQDNAATMMNVESYKNNKYDMMNVIKAYSSIMSTPTYDDEYENESNFDVETDVSLDDELNEGLWGNILKVIGGSKEDEIPEVEDIKAKGKKLRDRMRSLPLETPEE